MKFLILLLRQVLEYYFSFLVPDFRQMFGYHLKANHVRFVVWRF
jgi:hypothetical protein